MRLLPDALIATIALGLAAACFADTITLKNGRIINGTYLGGTARQIKVEVGDNIQTLDVGEIARIEFSNGGYSSSRETPRDDGRPTLRRADSDSGSSSGGSSYPGSGSPGSRPVILQPDPNDTGSYPSSGSSGSSYPSDNSRPTLRRSTASSSDSSSSGSSSGSSSDGSRPTLRRASDSSSSSAASTSDDDGRPVLHRATPDPAETAPQAAPVQIPAQTEFVVRLIDGVDSQTAKEGDLFRASVDQPVAIGGQTVVQRGVDAQVKLVQAQQSGKFTGKTELTLSLWTVTINGRLVPIDTQNITKASSSRGTQTAKVAGGAAAAGAVIGAIAGGGKGAAVGAGAGAAGGAAVEAATKGQRVKVASETLLTFVLDKSVDTSQGAAAAATAAPSPTPEQPQAQVAPLPPPPAPEPAPAPPTIKIGQTQDAVVAALGQPDSVDASGDKQIYIYKNVKVTFVNGKVSKVE